MDKYFRQLRPRERRRWNGTDGEFQRRRVRQHLREKQVRRPNVRGVRRQRVLQQPHHGLDQVKAVAAFNEQRRAGHCFVVDPPPARSFALFIRLMLIPGMYQIILTNNPSIASLTCLDARIPPVNLPREDLRATTSSPFLLHCGGRISFITPCHLIVDGRTYACHISHLFIPPVVVVVVVVVVVFCLSKYNISSTPSTALILPREMQICGPSL